MMSSQGVHRRQSLNTRSHGDWLQIQKNTFTNWVNEGLKPSGIVISDIRTDFSDGVNLVALVESLTGHRISGTVPRPSNQYQQLQNITEALNAIANDGIRIVNIDSIDINGCNLKLILALVWQLVLKYQVGLSVTQHKDWILMWLDAVIPDCTINNFTTDWNDGIALHALLDFCKPGLAPNWRELSTINKLKNCQSAMNIARQNFNIPLILKPEDLSSPQMDERSFITYLSYFLRVGGPGYEATLQRVSSRTQPKRVSNFTTDWQDGTALVNLVKSAGGHVVESPYDRGQPLTLIEDALEAGRHLGVEPFLSPERIASESTEHLGMMAYGAQYLRYPNFINYHDHNERTVLVENHHTTTRSHHELYNGHLSVSNNNINMVRDSNHNLSQPLRVNTVYTDDDASSARASTITSPSTTGPPTFHLVRKSSIHYPRVEHPTTDQLKVDIYSVGVIMESKMTGSFDPELFKVEAVAPSGRVIRIHGDGQYAAQFNADEIGQWKVSMFYDNRYMDGCPIDVCDPSQVKIRDLQGGHVGKANIFHVDCTKAGPGDLGVDVTHNGRNVSTYISPTSTPGYHKVSFTPYEWGPYEINVHFNRAEVREGDIEFFDPEERTRKAVFFTRVEPRNGYIEVKATCDWEVDYVTGRPFISHVTDVTDISVYGMEDGTVCTSPEMIADCTRVGEGRIEAEVTHNGMRYPCKIKKDKPLVYRISFKPRGPGTYKVWINYDGQPVKGSPFVQEIAELEKPSASGDGLYRGVPGKPANFIVDPRGFPGQVSASVTGPSKPVNCVLQPEPNNTIKGTYYPQERGPHIVSIRMDGRDIEGSPFRPLIVDPVKVRVSGGWRPYLDEKGIIPLRVDKEKHLPFDVTEAGPGELSSEVLGPNGKIPVAIDARRDGKHSVVFTPREEGKHYIHVSWGGYPLSSSPYLGYATYEPELDDDMPNYRLVPIGLNVPDRNLSPRSSPMGSVVDGPRINRPNGPDIYRPDDRYRPNNAYYDPNHHPNEVIYEPKRPPRIKVLPVSDDDRMYPEPRYIDNPSPNTLSPKSSTTSMSGPQKVILSGKGLKEAEVDKPAYFQVDGTRANPGSPSSQLKGVTDQVPVAQKAVKPQVYKCSYVPRKPGAYLLYVDWNGKPLKGSPFKVNVHKPVNKPEAKPEAKPHKVTATTDPRMAFVGRDYEMKIDPRHTGPGLLTVKCTDPKGQDVPVKLTDNHDGTKSLKVTPHMAGRHIVDILYNGGHIMGSPYAIDIQESQVKGHVKVWGPGIENGIIPYFQGTFWVEATGAGGGGLGVRIMGPKGAFKVKMRKASTREKIYQYFYDPVEPGVYTIDVTWSGQHIGGSPFTVLLATNEVELQDMQDELENNSDTTSVTMRSNRGRRSNKNSPRNSNEILY